MRRRTFVAATLVAALSGCVSMKTFQPTEITEVVDLPGKSKTEIFRSARQWFSQYFVSGESVVDYENEETGTIIGNGIADAGNDAFGIISYEIHYNIRIDVKDGKLRAATKVIKHTNTDTEKTYVVHYLSAEREQAAEQQVKRIVSEMKAYILSSKTESDW
ncbi:MAG: DUF4468 domain-containing protein [Gammaproteobacteria bacterium]|nr:DUF4468 domain-containing protein [Gammaproteobacteria bacterium]MCP5013861.1 DUF4468 domain-containing protein [Ketobacter sp.]